VIERPTIDKRRRVAAHSSVAGRQDEG
jgi:hypothetical protein